MDWAYLLNSFDGRIGRKTFWIAMAAVTAAEIPDHLLAETIQGDRLSAIVDLAFTYPEFAIAVKRGHDRNMPLWLLIAFFRAGAEERDQEPQRHVAVVAALHRDREFGIGECQIDDGAKPVALDRFSEQVVGNFGGRDRGHCNPKCLAADAAIEAVEEIGPIHRYNLTSISQQFVDAGLGPRLLVDAL